MQKGKQLWESGNRAEAVKHFQQGVKTTWQMAHELIKVNGFLWFVYHKVLRLKLAQVHVYFLGHSCLLFEGST